VVSYRRGIIKCRLLPDAEIIALYIGGMDSDSVSYRAGCCAKIVLDLVRKAGHTVRPPGRGSGRPLKLSSEEIVRRYRSGESGVSIAVAAGCVASTIYGVLRREGVQLRDRNPRAAAAQATIARRLRKATPT
jgi:transposase